MTDNRRWLEPTAAVVASFVNCNRVDAASVPDLIRSISRAFNGLYNPEPEAEPEERKATAAQIRRSITDAGLISFEDGRSYRLLKRHLRAFNLTPDQYRAKWGLGSDYPMTAPSYSVKRSALAKASGLGRKGGPPPAPEKPKRGRPRKTA